LWIEVYFREGLILPIVAKNEGRAPHNQSQNLGKGYGDNFLFGGFRKRPEISQREKIASGKKTSL